MAVACSRCGAKQGVMAALSADLASGTYTCPTCTEAIARETQEKVARLRQAAVKVLVTTTHSIDGYRITKYIGIESVEVVVGTGVFSEVTSDVQDFFGRRSTGFEGKLQAAKKAAFEAFTMIAADRDAHAIVGVDIDYTEFSGNRIGLVVNGTLVQLAAL